MSCNKLGQYSCLRCKICFCDEHVRRKGVKYEKNQAFPCPKCSYVTKETKELSMSTRNYDFGRKGAEGDDDEYYNYQSSSYSNFDSWRGNHGDEDDDEEDSDFDPDEDDEEEESESD